MAVLTRYGNEVRSVFDLLGTTENDITSAFAYTAAQCPALLNAFLRRVWPSAADLANQQVDLAVEVRGSEGRTDLEIHTLGAMVMVEAKRGWQLPSVKQLRQYVTRVRSVGSGTLVTLSQASQALAHTLLPTEIDGVPVMHLPWRDVLADVDAVMLTAHGQERQWLSQFRAYLKEVVRIRSVSDSWKYSVVLSNERPGGGGPYTFRQFVTDEKCYFHPYGTGGWPTEPPNFLAFRWQSAVHRIHRVVKADVVPSLPDRWPDIPITEGTARPHAIYELGPRLPPHQPIPNGAQYRASRLWVLLDQLQVAATLADALDQTRILNGR